MMKKSIYLIAVLFLLQTSIAIADYDTLWTKYTHHITKLQFSNDDSKILTVGRYDVIIFDTETGDELHRIQIEGPDRIWDACYSHDGSLIIVTRESFDDVNHLFAFIDVYDALTYELIKTIFLHQLPIEWGYSRSIISPDGNTIVLKNILGIFFIDYHSGKVIKHIEYNFNHEHKVLDEVIRFVYSKEGNHIIYTAKDKKLRFLNTHTYEVDYISNKCYGAITISDDGSMIACRSNEEDQAVSIMNTETKEIIGSIPGNASSVRGICFSPDNNSIAVSTLGDKEICIYYIHTLEIIRKFVLQHSNGKYYYFDSPKFSKNGKYIAASGGILLVLFNNNTISVKEDGNLIQTIFPNPATNMVQLKFDLSLTSEITLFVTNSLGENIVKLSYGILESGTNTINYDCSKLPNGIYFLTLSGNNFKTTYKLVKEG